MKNNIKTIFDIIKELTYILNKKQKKYVAVVMIVIIISSFFELLGVTAILPFVQAVLTPEKIFASRYARPFVEFFHITTPRGVMLLCGAGIIVLYLIKNMYILFSYYIQYDFATKVQKELSVKMLQAYMSRPYSYFFNVNSAEILRGCSSDTGNVYNSLSYLFTIVTEIITMCLIGGFIIYTEPGTAMGILLLMCVVMLGMIGIFKPAAKRAGRAERTANVLKYKAVNQTVSGIKEIYVMQRQKLFLQEYDEAADIARKAQRINSFITNSPDRIIEGICVSGLVGIICIRLFMDSNMIDFVPKLAAFAMAAFKVLPSIGKITSRINGLVYSRPSLTNVYNVMKEADEYDRYYVQYAKEHGEIKESDELFFTDKLEIRNVSWQYENQKAPVLENTMLEIKKGQSIALIGASGAGKTTLADIILGLLRPQNGTVLMDGIDVYAMPKTWARIVGYVPQSVFLIDDTVRNNIAFGLPYDTIQDELVWDALERAQLKEFIKGLPKGLDTIVGERGVKFSGGQRQRIAIARALYNRPEILILDEATAALDNETETAVMESIDALRGRITMVIVAHRLTTIRNCDKIYEIRDGKAIERDKEEVLSY
ncbi:MAG: ABC transporter ATP-binding protein [Lachnospiraceae bacterium]|nr:ABC transporter ATP-binding protein [Lachnospiraceae bacterium]